MLVCTVQEVELDEPQPPPPLQRGALPIEGAYIGLGLLEWFLRTSNFNETALVSGGGGGEEKRVWRLGTI